MSIEYNKVKLGLVIYMSLLFLISLEGCPGGSINAKINSHGFFLCSWTISLCHTIYYNYEQNTIFEGNLFSLDFSGI